jgi:MFS family permease
VALRLLTGLFLGSEWSTGVTLVAETWPDEARPKGAGILQSALGWGTLLASLVWLVLQPLGAQAWRLMFVVGVTPALFALYIRKRLDESERWADAVRRGRWGATAEDIRALEAAGAVGTTTRRPFTLAAIFRQRESRRRVLLSVLLSLSTMIGWWAISTWLPTYAQALARGAGVANAPAWGSIAGLLYTAGAIVGYTLSGFLADAIGRRPYLIFMYGGSLLLTPVTYLWVHSLPGFLVAVAVNGFFTLAQYAWFAVYLPELFTSTVRSTAIGFVFNASRLVAWLGPLAAGSLIQYFGGIPKAAVAFGFIYVLGLVVAPFMPETRGQPLPE